MNRTFGRVNKREEALHNLEIARRARLQPVQCWERQWVAPTGAIPGSSYKVYKWVKTEKTQEFSDDDLAAGVDEQQAPLRDEMEALAGAADQEVEEQEAADRDRGDDDSHAGSDEEGPKGPRLLVVDDTGTGDITPAEPGDRSPKPPSPSPAAPAISGEP